MTSRSASCKYLLTDTDSDAGCCSATKGSHRLYIPLPGVVVAHRPIRAHPRVADPTDAVAPIPGRAHIAPEASTEPVSVNTTASSDRSTPLTSGRGEPIGWRVAAKMAYARFRTRLTTRPPPAPARPHQRDSLAGDCPGLVDSCPVRNRPCWKDQSRADPVSCRVSSRCHRCGPQG